MEKKQRWIRLSLAALVSVWFAFGMSGSAMAFIEVGDASSSLGGEQNAGVYPLSITGSIGTDDEGDLFAFTLSATKTLTIGVSAPIDTVLFLFDGSGGGILVDDDSGPGLLSSISTTLAAGSYIIGICDFDCRAVDTDGDPWPGGFTSQSPPPASFGTLDFIENTSVIGTGSYVITFVPEPATILLFTAGLAGLGVMRRRRLNA